MTPMSRREQEEFIANPKYTNGYPDNAYMRAMYPNLFRFSFTGWLKGLFR